MMFKRVLILTTVLAILVSLSPLGALAKDQPKPADPAKPTAETKTTPAQVTPPGHAPQPVANTIAVCGCGMVFMTDAKTPYLESEGKLYACCTEGCHKMAMENPKKSAEMAQANTAKVLGQVSPAPAKTSSAPH